MNNKERSKELKSQDRLKSQELKKRLKRQRIKNLKTRMLNQFKILAGEPLFNVGDKVRCKKCGLRNFGGVGYKYRLTFVIDEIRESSISDDDIKYRFVYFPAAEGNGVFEPWLELVESAKDSK